MVLCGAWAGVEDFPLITERHTNWVELAPGSDDAKIARLVATLLERSHYSQQPINETTSSKFLDRYIDSLDPAHMIFLQSDAEQFERWRTMLGEMALRFGNTTPAYAIFNRFMKRFEEQVAYSTNALKENHFTFDGNDRYLINRHEAPRPKDETEARRCWLDHVRYEYLQEWLNLVRPQEVAQNLRKRLEKETPEKVLANLRASRQKAEALAKLGNTNGASTTSTNAPVLKLTNMVTQTFDGKLSDERANELVRLVEDRLGKESLEAVLKAVQTKIEERNHEEIVKLITRRYARQTRMLMEFDQDEILQIYLTALCHAYDPHSDYMSRSSLENFNISMKLSLFGIGAVLRFEDGYCKIMELMPGPAQRSGQVKPNDRIIMVAQGTNEPVDVVDMKLNKVVELIRGPKGTEVRLTIIPADAPDPSIRKQLTLIRDEIKLEDQEAKAKIIELPSPDGPGHPPVRLGLLDLPSFYADLESRKATRKSTTTDVARLLTKLKEQNVAGVVLDLRRNGGGSLEEAINLTGLFIKEGPVVQVRDPNGKVTVDEDTDDSILYDGPLVVLTSRASASASEILAGALQDYGRALVVGDISTHGKGTVQSLVNLGPLLRMTNNLGAIKFTIRKFYRASGSSTQLKGVVPDLILPSVANYYDGGEASLTNALPWDTIPSAKFVPVNLIKPCLAELKKHSDERISASKDWDLVRQEIERYKKIKDDKTVSMNEAQRLKEKKEAEDFTQMRKTYLRSLPEPEEKVYDITLKNVDLPGLPPPTLKTNLTASVGGTNGTTVAKAATDATSAAELANATRVTSPKSATDEEDTDEDGVKPKDDATPNVDFTMREARLILLDLMRCGKSGALAGPTGTPTANQAVH